MKKQLPLLSITFLISCSPLSTNPTSSAGKDTAPPIDPPANILINSGFNSPSSNILLPAGIQAGVENNAVKGQILLPAGILLNSGILINSGIKPTSANILINAGFTAQQVTQPLQAAVGMQVLAIDGTGRTYGPAKTDAKGFYLLPGVPSQIRIQLKATVEDNPHFVLSSIVDTQPKGDTIADITTRSTAKALLAEAAAQKAGVTLQQLRLERLQENAVQAIEQKVIQVLDKQRIDVLPQAKPEVQTEIAKALETVLPVIVEPSATPTPLPSPVPTSTPGPLPVTGNGLFLIQPNAGFVVTQGANLTIEATAIMTGVALVEFYDGSEWVGVATQAPYRVNWNTSGRATGSHLLKAIAKGSQGNVLGDSMSISGNIISSPSSTPTPSSAALPAVPTGLVASSVTLNAFTLSWAGASGATSYKIYKDGILYATQSGNSVNVTGLAANTTSTMTVAAVNSSGDTSQSSGLSVTTLANAPTGLGTNTVTSTSFNLTWNAVAGVTSYKVYRDGIPVANPAGNSQSITGLTANTTYTMTVSVVNAGGESAQSTALNQLTTPAVPSGLASNTITSSSFNLTWNAVAGATSYKVYRNGTLVVSPAGTSQSITGLTASTTYAMTVSAVNAGGESAQSTALNVATSSGLVTVSTYAGSSTSGSADGVGTAAQFNSPQGVGVDSAGNVFVVDRNNIKIRKITTDGTVATLAGLQGSAGSNDGVGTAARFNDPYHVVVDPVGNLFVADRVNNKIRKITSNGTVSTFAGNFSGSNDGVGTAARFNAPLGIAIDSAGNLFVTEQTGARIRKITSSGTVTTIAGTGTSGFSDGMGTAAQFNIPHGIAVDTAGNLFVADRGNHKIRKITTDGTVSTFAGFNSGFSDGLGTVAQFNNPHGIVVDAAGNLFVTDLGNVRIRKIDSSGAVTTWTGTLSGTADGIGTAARFSAVDGIAIDSVGNLFVADAGANQSIRKITP